MAMECIKCPVCGNTEMFRAVQLAQGEYWHCECCGATLTERVAKKEYDKIAATIEAGLDNMGFAVTEAFVKEKLELFESRRANLIKKVKANYIDSKEIVKICHGILEIRPGDFLAEFFEIANSGTVREVAEYINGIDEQENAAYMDLVLEFITRSLKEEYITPTAALLERCSKMFTPEKKQEHYTRFETEAALVKEGNYEVGVSRDVFLAYSSKDLPEVRRLLDFIESEEIGLTCFAAFRNLQHGRDAVANYEQALKQAMDNCDIFLFVSSVNSRSFNCDAFKVEMAYIRSSDMKKLPECRNYAQLPEKYRKLRIEYRLDNKKTPLVERNMKDFFTGLTYAEDHDQLVERLGYCMSKLNGEYEYSDNGADSEAKAMADEIAKLKAELEAKNKADEEQRRAQSEAKRKADEEERMKALEAKIRAEYEEKLKAETAAKRKAEEEAKRKAEEEAKRKADAEAKAKLNSEFDRIYSSHLQKKNEVDLNIRQIEAVIMTKRDAYKAQKRRYELSKEKRARKDYKNGYYVGEYADDNRNGYGIFYWNGGDQYEGTWTDDKKTGYATVTHKSGNRYEGDMLDGKRNGYGTYYWNNGESYVGKFVENARTGYGTYYYADGDRYQGAFVDSERNGYGILYKRNGDAYSGTWTDASNATDVVKIAANGQKSYGKYVGGKFIKK